MENPIAIFYRSIICCTIVFNALAGFYDNSAHGQSYDFRYSLRSASQEGSEKYVVEKLNVKIFVEDFNTKCSYWGVVRNDVPARLTFRFPLKEPVESALLNTNMLAANFQNARALGAGKGSGSLWCSPDGREWIQLQKIDSPVDKAVDLATFVNRLPPELKGKREIWIQVRMNASEMKGSDYSTAQFARNMHHNDPNMIVFDLRVKCQKSPAKNVAENKTKQTRLPNP